MGSPRLFSSVAAEKYSLVSCFRFFCPGWVKYTPGLFVARIAVYGLAFVTHAIPPQRAVGSRASAHLCIISTAAIQALEPDCFSPGNSFFHVCSFLHVSTVHQHFKAVSCCKFDAMSLQYSLFARCSWWYLASMRSASARAFFTLSSSAFCCCHPRSRRCSSMRT